MASTSDELFAAIADGDVDRVRALLENEPALADARDHEGVSALHARPLPAGPGARRGGPDARR